jgi:hypothetical protein
MLKSLLTQQASTMLNKEKTGTYRKVIDLDQTALLTKLSNLREWAR